MSEERPVAVVEANTANSICVTITDQMGGSGPEIIVYEDRIVVLAKSRQVEVRS